jgi:hypothetical protein
MPDSSGQFIDTLYIAGTMEFAPTRIPLLGNGIVSLAAVQEKLIPL